MYYSRQIKGKMLLKNVEEMKRVLRGDIFMRQNAAYVFEENQYVIIPGNTYSFITGSSIVWEDIKPKYDYTIFQYESNFILRTFSNEIHPKDNEFIILVHGYPPEKYMLTFIPVHYKMERIILYAR